MVTVIQAQKFLLLFFDSVIEHLYREHCKEKGRQQPGSLDTSLEEELMLTENSTFWQKVQFVYLSTKMDDHQDMCHMFLLGCTASGNRWGNPITDSSFRLK